MEEFFEQFWEKRFQKATRLMNDTENDDERSPIEALMEMWLEEGFMPEYKQDKENGMASVKECNCPRKNFLVSNAG